MSPLEATAYRRCQTHYFLYPRAEREETFWDRVHQTGQPGPPQPGSLNMLADPWMEHKEGDLRLCC